MISLSFHYFKYLWNIWIIVTTESCTFILPSWNSENYQTLAPSAIGKALIASGLLVMLWWEFSRWGRECHHSHTLSPWNMSPHHLSPSSPPHVCFSIFEGKHGAYSPFSRSNASSFLTGQLFNIQWGNIVRKSTSANSVPHDTCFALVL